MLGTLVSLSAKAQLLPIHGVSSREPVMPRSGAWEAQEECSLMGAVERGLSSWAGSSAIQGPGWLASDKVSSV